MVSLGRRMKYNSLHLEQVHSLDLGGQDHDCLEVEARVGVRVIIIRSFQAGSVFYIIYILYILMHIFQQNHVE